MGIGGTGDIEKSGAEGGGGAIKHCLRARTSRMGGLPWTESDNASLLGAGSHSGAEPSGTSREW